MENKNKKDMSVDDLVKQLRLVLDINDEDEEKPAKEKEEEIIPMNNQGKSPESDSTIKPANIGNLLIRRTKWVNYL